MTSWTAAAQQAILREDQHKTPKERGGGGELEAVSGSLRFFGFAF